MPSRYVVSTVRAVEKDLDRLATAVVPRIITHIEALADDPRPPGTEALKGYPGYYRIRVGHYRIVYGVDDAARTVTVIEVYHRRSAYDVMRRRL